MTYKYGMYVKLPATISGHGVTGAAGTGSQVEGSNELYSTSVVDTRKHLPQYPLSAIALPRIITAAAAAAAAATAAVTTHLFNTNHLPLRIALYRRAGRTVEAV
jgi:hypothetical protein